ncbi:MAG: DeoR family transcriptional regulator [Patescibacteria group bacterium]
MEDKFIKITNEAYKILDFFPESDPLKNKAKKTALSVMESLILSGNWRIKKDNWTPIKDILQENKEKLLKKTLEEIEILLSFFKLGKLQGWISDSNFLIIYNEYEKIKEEVFQYLPKYQLPLRENFKEILKEEIINDKTEASFKKDELFATVFLPPDKTEEPKQNLIPDKLSGAKEKESANLENIISERQKKIIKFLEENKKAQVMDLKKVLKDVTKRTIRRDLDDLLKKGNIVRVGEWNQVFYQIS